MRMPRQPRSGMDFPTFYSMFGPQAMVQQQMMQDALNHQRQMNPLFVEEKQLQLEQQRAQAEMLRQLFNGQQAVQQPQSSGLIQRLFGLFKRNDEAPMPEGQMSPEFAAQLQQFAQQQPH